MKDKERRRYKRIPVYFKTADISVIEPPFNKGYIKDISEGGLRMDVTTKIDISTIILLNFTLPDESFNLKNIGAKVVWVERGKIGVEFIDLRINEKEIIKNYIEENKHMECPSF